MNYTDKNVRQKLYRERTSLDDFEMDKLGPLNKFLLSIIEESDISNWEDGEECTLNIFNNAYYITAAIMNEKRPTFHFREFISITHFLDYNSRYYDLQCCEAATMGLVHNYLALCDEKFLTHYSPLLKKLEDRFDTSSPYSEHTLYYDLMLPPGSIVSIRKEIGPFDFLKEISLISAAPSAPQITLSYNENQEKLTIKGVEFVEELGDSQQPTPPKDVQPEMVRLRAELESVKGQLEHVLAEKRALEQKVSELSQPVPQPSTLRIADKKKTPVMVVLHAMYKAGWIKAGTRDETVIEAARLLFGESVTSLRQLLSIAKSNGTFSSYIEKAENSMENEWDELKNAVKDEK